MSAPGSALDPEPEPESSGPGRSSPEGAVVIGVAIAVPPPHADVLQRWRADFGDPRAWSIPTHVTLVPPTPVPVAALAQVADHLRLSAAQCPAFDLVLEGTDTFRPISPVVFVRVAEGAPECSALEKRVRSGVLEGERRFPYHPHVTVAHDLPAAALDRARTTLATFGASFSVRAVQLYRHGSDGVWRTVAEFALAGS